jgi:putative ABC transport system permease protein
MRAVTLKGLLARKLRLALTALAIVLGVTFVTGTLILGDTLNRTFDNLIGTVYQHVSFEVRGDARLVSNAQAVGVDSTDFRRPVPQSVLASVRRIPGVAFAAGSVAGYAQFVDRAGNAIGNSKRAQGFSFDPNRSLSSVHIVAGRAPVGPREVLMDLGTARKNGFRVGQQVRVLLPGRPQTFTISGLVKFGSADNLVGVSLAGFALPVAQQLFNSRGSFDTINVLAKQGADNVALQRAIAGVLPPGVQVVSGQQIVNEYTSAISSALSFITTALLVFAFIALFVGAFTIFNTFSITVGQRTRELALLRVVGASRRQVFRSVLAEAALTGLGASAVGIGLGVLAALGLKALLGAFGITLPSSPLVFEARTPVVALIVGVGVTVVAAIAPARRAVAIPPVAALMAQLEDPSESSPRRIVLGCVIGALGLFFLAGGLAQALIGLVGLGTLALFVATAMLMPLVARPVAGALGRPLAALRGAAGRLGRENSMRSPRRTAQTASALMVGMALVSTIAVLGSSLAASATTEVNRAVAADYLVTAGSMSRDVVPTIAKLPGIETVSTVYSGQFDFEGSLSSLHAISPARLSRTLSLQMTAGSAAPALAAGELLVDSQTAGSKHLHVGSLVPVAFVQTGSTQLRVGGIYEQNPLVGSFVVSDRLFLAHFNNPLPVGALVRSTPGATGVERELNRALAAYANLSIQSRAQFEHAAQSQVNQLLGLIYVLLALAIVIALIGIVNTLMLSVFERTREIGLLRAVGMKRRQVKAMIRSEAVVIALFGALVGIVIGTCLGVALSWSLRNNGVSVISVPAGSLIAFVVLATLLGLGAATWPARRAASLDVLRAIATE